MVMLVPPGVGRRKRDLDEEHHYQSCNSNQAFLQANSTHFSLTHCNQTLVNITYDKPLTDEFLEEIPLGIVMTINAMTVAQGNNLNIPCQNRNFCEFGLNCGFFGTGSIKMCTIGSIFMSRWISHNDNEENNFLTAFTQGTNLANCHDLYDSQCNVAKWNTHLDAIRTNVSASSTCLNALPLI